MASSRSVLFPSQVEANPAASSKVGKKAKNKLKVIACDMMPHRGNTRANTFHTLLAKSDLTPMPHYIHCLLEASLILMLDGFGRTAHVRLAVLHGRNPLLSLQPALLL
jgi:hypothetical protein